MAHAVGLKVDPKSGEPLYRQIFDQVVSRIEARAFPPGYKLPPARLLARELSTHRNTVARAYGDLEAAGFVSSQVGRGTFVERPSTSSHAKAGVTGASDRTSDRRQMAWSSLLSRAVRAEWLGRADRYARRPPGRDMVNLARMQPSEDLIPHELMMRCLTHVGRERGAAAMTYAPTDGLLRLRTAIAEDLSSRGVPTNADDVLITSGSQQAIDLLARALVNPGETVLIDTTSYSHAIELFATTGARLVAVPSDVDGPDPKALERLARADVKLLYLMPNGHNPTGRTISAERRRELVAWSQASGIPIIEDDYGAGLALDGEPELPALRALDGEVVYVSTFSKRLIPALRVGFLVCPAALKPSLVSLKRVTDLGTSALLQHALAEFMERGYLRAHMNRILPEYRVRRDALTAALRKYLPSDVKWHRPNHGVVFWLQLPSGLDVDEVFEEAFRQGVQVSPGPIWSVDSAVDRDNGFRVAFCSESPERLTEGARRLGKAIRLVASRAPHDRSQVATAEIA